MMAMMMIEVHGLLMAVVPCLILWIWKWRFCN